MHNLIGGLQAHEVLFTLAAYYIFSSIVGGMPSPDEKSGKAYVWLFNSLHILAGNIARIPQVRQLIEPDGK